MKTRLISLALLTMIPGSALAHQVYVTECDDNKDVPFDGKESFDKKVDTAPIKTGGLDGILAQGASGSGGDAEQCYSDSPESKELRNSHSNTPESDRVAALTFCKMGGYENVVDCASDVLNKGLADAAKNCVNQAIDQVNKIAITPYAHQLGSNGSGAGVWHQDYAYSKEDGWHRHDWSKEAREGAGNTYAAAQIEFLKKQYSTISTSKTDTTTSTGSLNIGGAVGVGAPVGPSVEINGGAGVSGTSEHGTSTDKGPLTDAQLKKLWDKYYNQAYNNPQLGSVHPDIYCARNERNCVASSGAVVKNVSYQPDAPSKKEESNSNKSEDKKTPHKSSENESKIPGSSSSDSFPNDNTIETNDGGSWAGEPSKPSDGSVWADFGQVDPGHDPMGQCIFNALREKTEEGSNKTYDTGSSADKRSEAQKKRDAETLLKKGICDEKYFGRDYCVSWKKRREMIDSTPDVLDGEKPIMTPGKQSERPGYLHFDQDSLPIVIPDLGPNVVPGGSGSEARIPKLK